jgi:methylated-DNA-[protein]-cysteine S-methyltransferase
MPTPHPASEPDRTDTGFDTAFGRCSLGWTAAGLCRVRLPGPGVSALTLPRAQWPAFVCQAVDGIVDLLATGRADFNGLPLDLRAGSDFEREVWHLTCTIPAGRTLTYGELARRLGDAGAARAVGVALGRNPLPLVVPCHRVLGAQGALVGFSAPGGVSTKARLLALEGAQVGDQPQLF